MSMTYALAPGSVPLLGHALSLRKSPLDFFRQLSNHGDLVEIRIGPRRVYVPTHPDLVWNVLVDSKTYDKGGDVFREARSVLGNGLATCDHATHRRQRLLMQPSFHGDRLVNYGSMMTEVIGGAIDRWQDGEVINVTKEMMLITTRIAALTLASLRIDDANAQETLELFSTITHVAYMRIVAPTRLAERIPTPKNRRYWKARKRLDDVVTRTIDYYRQTGTDYGDIMSSLLASKDDAGGMSAAELYDQVTILLTGEIETTGAALAWAFHLLAKNPEIGELVHQEARQVLGDRVATWSDLPNLPLAYRVLNEVMRVYPPVWFLTRTTTRDVTVAGQTIPAGADFLFCPYVVHHHAKYFPEPEKFDPDRWLPGRQDGLPKGAYVPFAAGARKCIGDHFALGEAVIALSSISARWQLEKTTDAPLRPIPRSILRPHALPMRTHRRASAIPPQVPASDAEQYPASCPMSATPRS